MSSGQARREAVSTRLLLLLLLGFAWLVVLRLPEALFEGRFWAEEGRDFFAAAWRQGVWPTLVEARDGYLPLWANLAVVAATWVPLENAPQVTAGFALAAQLSVALLLLAAPPPGLEAPWHRGLALLAVLLAPPSHEIWLTSIASQFHFSLAAALLLVVRLEGRARLALAALLLLLAGASGPVPTFLAPLFLLKGWRERAPAHAALGGLLGLLALLHLYGYWLLPTDPRGLDLDPGALAWALANKLAVLPLLGLRGADTVGAGIVAGDASVRALALGLALLHLAVLGGLLAAARAAPPAWLLAAGAWLALLSMGLALDPWPAPLLGVPGGRYVYAANALVNLSLLSGLVALAPSRGGPGRRALRTLALLLLAVRLGVGALEYARPERQFVEGPHWREQVRAWRADPAYRPLIWPGPSDWSIELRLR